MSLLSSLSIIQRIIKVIILQLTMNYQQGQEIKTILMTHKSKSINLQLKISKNSSILVNQELLSSETRKYRIWESQSKTQGIDHRGYRRHRHNLYPRELLSMFLNFLDPVVPFQLADLQMKFYPNKRQGRTKYVIHVALLLGVSTRLPQSLII